MLHVPIVVAIVITSLLSLGNGVSPPFTNHVYFENFWPKNLQSFKYTFLATQNIVHVTLVGNKVGQHNMNSEGMTPVAFEEEGNVGDMYNKEAPYLSVQGTLSGYKIKKKEILFLASFTASKISQNITKKMMNITIGQKYSLKFNPNSFRWRSTNFQTIFFHITSGAEVICPKHTFQKEQGMACCPISCGPGKNNICESQPTSKNPGTCTSTVVVVAPSPSTPSPSNSMIHVTPSPGTVITPSSSIKQSPIIISPSSSKKQYPPQLTPSTSNTTTTNPGKENIHVILTFVLFAIFGIVMCSVWKSGTLPWGRSTSSTQQFTTIGLTLTGTLFL